MRFLDFNFQPLNAQDPDVGETLGVDGEGMEETVQTHGAYGKRELDFEEELLAARNEECVRDGAASSKGGAVISKCVDDLIDNILGNYWLRHMILSRPPRRLWGAWSLRVVPQVNVESRFPEFRVREYGKLKAETRKFD